MAFRNFRFRAILGVVLVSLLSCAGRVEIADAGGSASATVQPCAPGEVLPQRKEDCATVADEDCAVDCPGEYRWSRVFGDGSLGLAIATDQAGAAVVGGDYEGAEWCDAFVSKVDGSGSPAWNHRYSSDPCSGAEGVATNSAGDVWVTGAFESSLNAGGWKLSSTGSTTIFILRLNGSGEHVWAKAFGGQGQDFGWAIAVDPNDNVVVAGSFSEAVDFGGGMLFSQGKEDLFVAKLDASGNHLWSKGFGAGAYERPSGVAVDAAGNVLVVGHTDGGIDFGQGPIPEGPFVAKFDPAGNSLWSHGFSGAESLVANGVATDSQGNVVMVGWIRGSVDFGGGLLVSADDDAFAVKLAPDGSHLWSRLFGAGGSDVARGVAVTAKDEVLLTGDTKGGDFGGGPLPSKGEYEEAFVAKLDSLGNHLWSWSFGGGGSQGLAVAADPSGNVFVTGYFHDDIDLGAGPEQHDGEHGFLVKLAP
jgi:DNA-binding beta-propeller fold protein YncE